MKNGKCLLIILSMIINPMLAGNDYLITDFGAKAQAKTVNTTAIQAAIDQCHADGGGKVVVPRGTFLTGSIELKSHVELHLEKGAVLLGSPNLADYKANAMVDETLGIDYVGWRSIVYAGWAEQISITGQGTIDGNMLGINIKENSEAGRTSNIVMFRCEDVRIENIRLINSVAWMQHYVLCEEMHLHGITVHTRLNTNTDGFDITDCRNVIISDCNVNSDDDGICLKGSVAPTENITITNCLISSSCNAIKFGSGGYAYRNITISNCVIKKPDEKKVFLGRWGGIAAIALNAVDSTVIEQVNISNISIEGTLCPIFIRLGDRKGIGRVSGINISNITASNEGQIANLIMGLPGHPIEHVQLSNIHMIAEGGGTESQAEAFVPEEMHSYPEATAFGGGSPAHGFYVRHASQVSFRQVSLMAGKADKRPAIELNNVNGFSINGLLGQKALGSQPLVKINQSQNGMIGQVRALTPVENLIGIRGENSKAIFIGMNFTANVVNEYTLSQGAKETEIKK